MTESTLNVGDVEHWEQVNASGFILTHWVFGGRLLTSPRWLRSVFVRPGVHDLEASSQDGTESGCRN